MIHTCCTYWDGARGNGEAVRTVENQEYHNSDRGSKSKTMMFLHSILALELFLAQVPSALVPLTTAGLTTVWLTLYLREKRVSKNSRQAEKYKPTQRMDLSFFCEHNFIFHSLLSIFDLRVSTDPVAMAEAKFHIYLRHEGALTSLWGIGVFFIPDSNYKRHQSFYKRYTFDSLRARYK